MSDSTTTRGKIIRILDTTTVAINMGTADGISPGYIFRVLATPENVVDPSTGDVLGAVALVKVRLRADRVYERFTIAKSKWTTTESGYQSLQPPNTLAWLGGITNPQVPREHGGELDVDPLEIQPWRGVAEEKVRVGDVVEVVLPAANSNPTPPKA